MRERRCSTLLLLHVATILLAAQSSHGFLPSQPARRISLIASSSSESEETTVTDTSEPDTGGAQFGDSCAAPRISRPAQQEGILQDAVLFDAPQAEKVTSENSFLRKQRKRSIVTAVLSVLVAVANYGWQYTHPITPVQLLAEMQQSSAPVTAIGTNGKPSVVDFWAPWCENCKLAAPTLLKIEEEYKDRVNFVMVNGDQPQAWPYIEAFGVDAIPHMALVSAEGDVETALIGPIPKSVLTADLDVLIANSDQAKEKQPLPYKMLDVFANHPDKRRVHFDE